MAVSQERIDAARAALQNRKATVDPARVEAAKKALAARSASVTAPKQSNAVVDFAKGVGKGGLSTVKGASSLGENLIKGLGRLVTPKQYEKALGFAKTEQSSAQQLQDQAEGALGIERGTLTTPTNTAQKAGFMTEQIGEFFVPGTTALKAGKAVAGSAKLAKASGAVKGLAKLATTAATEGVLASGQTALQKGEFDKEARWAALTGAAMPFAGAGLSRLARPLGGVAKNFVGTITGAGSTAFDDVFKRPEVIQLARQAGRRGPEDFLNETVDLAREGLKAIRKNRSDAYQKTLAELDLASKNIPQVLDTTRQKMASLADDLDTIVEGQNVIEKAMKDVRSWDDATALGVDKLKQRLASYSEQLSAPGKTKAKRIVDELAATVRNGLRDNVKGYTELTRPYQEASDLIDEITRSLSLGNKAQIETTARKLMQTVRRDDDTRRVLLEELAKASGHDISGRVTGALLAQKMPRGVMGPIITAIQTGSIPVVISHPSSLVVSLPVFALSSPRLMGELTALLGKINKSMIKNNALSVPLQRAFRELLLKAHEDQK